MLRPRKRGSSNTLGGLNATPGRKPTRIWGKGADELLWSCKVIRLGDHVVVKGADDEAIVTAVHPDSQVEIEFLHASEGGSKRRRYAAEALEKISR